MSLEIQYVNNDEQIIFILRERGGWKGPSSGFNIYDMDASLLSIIIINELQDTQLLARIVGVDLIAMNAKYHLNV